jgi:transglutaminase-like putative cysteine protease
MGDHRVTLIHRTEYHYERPVRLGPQWVRLRPLPDPGVDPAPYRLTVEPAPLSLHWQVDPLGNHVARLVLPQPLALLTLEVEIELDLAPSNPFDFLLEPGAGQWPFRYEPDVADALAAFRRADHAGPLLGALWADTAAPLETVPFVLNLAARVRDAVAYIVRMEPGVWPPDLTLAEARGSCRDSAWVLVQLLRMHGLAARFVSGYLVQRPEDGSPPGAELHAWAEAFLPGAGWIGIDATSGFLTAEGHVPLAASPDPMGAAPLSGTVEPGAVRLETSVVVRPAA